MLGIITISKSGLLKLNLMRGFFFFMYEKNLFSQHFPRVNHSFYVRKLIGNSSTFPRSPEGYPVCKVLSTGFRKTNSPLLEQPD